MPENGHAFDAGFEHPGFQPAFLNPKLQLSYKGIR